MLAEPFKQDGSKPTAELAGVKRVRVETTETDDNSWEDEECALDDRHYSNTDI